MERERRVCTLVRRLPPHAHPIGVVHVEGSTEHTQAGGDGVARPATPCPLRTAKKGDKRDRSAPPRACARYSQTLPLSFFSPPPQVCQPNGEVVITNDGATILNKMTLTQPAAKMLVELAKSQVGGKERGEENGPPAAPPHHFSPPLFFFFFLI